MGEGEREDKVRLGIECEREGAGYWAYLHRGLAADMDHIRMKCACPGLSQRLMIDLMSVGIFCPLLCVYSARSGPVGVFQSDTQTTEAPALPLVTGAVLARGANPCANGRQTTVIVKLARAGADQV